MHMSYLTKCNFTHFHSINMYVVFNQYYSITMKFVLNTHPMVAVLQFPQSSHICLYIYVYEII